MDDKTSKVRVSRDVTFNETEFDHNAEQAVIKDKAEIYSSLEGSEPQNENQHREDEGKQADQDRRQSQRQKGPAVRFGLDDYADD